jgi:hypothetical protein
VPGAREELEALFGAANVHDGDQLDYVSSQRFPFY